MIVDVYTDGSSLKNPGKGGWAAVMVVNANIIDRRSGGSNHATNNEMELTAFIQALVMINDNSNIDEVNIHSDSSYVVNGINQWAENWINNNEVSRPNFILWKSALAWLNYIRNKGVKVNLYWVKAHYNNQYNNLVDELARSEARAQ